MRKLFLFLAVIGVFFITSCEKDIDKDKDIDNEEELREYGLKGTHEVMSHTLGDDIFSSIYYPKDLSSISNKAPLVFLASGWFSEPQKATTYKSLIEFMVSHGAVVIYTYEGASTSSQYSINGYNKVINSTFVKNSIWDYVDIDKFGVVGHSAGGGMGFKIMDYFSKVKNYGNKGRFILTLDPWFAFDMHEKDMKTFPSNLNVVFIKFGEGGNNDADGTDARIPLTEFYLLESIAAKNKDYQIYKDADHSYPKGEKDYSSMQGILKPLDALMDYTFVKQSEDIRKIALENGNDDPYNNGNGIQVVKGKGDYIYPCDGADTFIDYCKIAP